jgi:rhamnosyltransferase subunit B
MARILIAWEFGAGLGHLTRLLPVAEGLGRQGHRLTLALHDLGAARAAGLATRLAATDFAIRQAPRWPLPRGPQVSRIPTHSLADVFKLINYHEAPLLYSMARAWRQLFREVSPDLIVADFSPTLRMAVAGECPILVIGNGYTIPPEGRRFPPIRPWEPLLPPESAAAEAAVYRAVATTMNGLGYPTVEYVSDLLSGTSTFICTIPEFDPYAAYRDKPTFDPFNLPTIDKVVPIDLRPANTAFLYMPGDHPDLPSALDAVLELGLSGAAYIPGLRQPLKDRLPSPRFRIFDSPQPLGRILPSVRVLIHHGGLSTAYAGLASATPQLIMTWNLEHLVTARSVKQFGAAIVTTQAQRSDVAAVATALRSLSTNRRLWVAAEAGAKGIAGRRRGDPLTGILGACRELLAA